MNAERGAQNAEQATSHGSSRAAAFEEQGFASLPGFASQEVTAKLRDAVTNVSGSSTRAGVRDLFHACPSVAAFAASPEVFSALSEFTRVQPFAVRAILFDKTPDANWLVAWHQDLTIAVRERRDTPGFGPWSVKDGVPHVQPPVELLAKMFTVRLHLDDCDASNGALRVLPGTHRHGKLPAEEIARCKSERHEQVCEARAGDALLMRPLLLHASSPAAAPRHRRVIHLEFAVDELPGGLEWAESIRP